MAVSMPSTNMVCGNSTDLLVKVGACSDAITGQSPHSPCTRTRQQQTQQAHTDVRHGTAAGGA